MRLLADVIVDVPTMQTDQPFTYLVPEWLTSLIAVGMRVEVPFGNGNRHIQGFVVGLREADELSTTMKDVVNVLDVDPILNDELLALADYMKETTYAFKITCLQTMLPAVLKAKYEKNVVLLDETHPVATQYFNERTMLTWDEAITSGLGAQMKKLRDEGVVDVRYEVQKKNKVKTRRLVQPALSAEALRAEHAQLRKGSKRKEQLLTLLAAGQTLPTTDYQAQGITTAILNQGVEAGWLTFIEEEIYRDPYGERTFAQSQPLLLNEEQAEAVAQITAAQTAQTFLLEGITGSGKTEVYLQAIATVLSRQQTAMMLVPEIALTPQMVERFKQRFGNAVAVLHSGLSQGEKYDEWRKIERQEAQVVVGARSAIFAPLTNIGLIIVDEEHETSYKQDEAPRYHARDLAIWRAKYHQCPVVLGSATPSLESRARAQKGVYQLLRLTKRANPEAQLPAITVVDMKDEVQHGGTFSRLLQEKITDRLAKQEQVVLLLNRRGYSSFVMCRSCGFVLPCPNCDISLTLHMDTKKMRCHYCEHEEPIPHRCPECQETKIRYYGTGTQKVEEELQALFPDVRILRMDVDTTRKKGAHERMLQSFGRQEAQILLGTQMIAKGLDFPNVTLVGVLNADTALNLPDFRSSERTFQLLTQVSGRAGRAHKAGEVVIQTFNPDNHAIVLAQAQQYEPFYQHEMRMRHRFSYPPYYFTVKITCSHTEEVQAAKKAFALAQQIRMTLSPQSILLGPTPSSIARVKNRYYYQLIIKYKHEPQLQPLLRQILTDSQGEQRQGLYVSIDNEPLHFI